MLYKKITIAFLIGCLVVTCIPTALCKTSAPPIVYVSGDRTGDFNCDGKADQIEINEALKFVADNPKYTTVHLKGPFTYTINSTIFIRSSNIILEGDSNTVVKLIDNAGWTNNPMIPMIGQKGSINNITIRGFEINANCAGNAKTPKGQGYYNCIYFNRMKNINVNNMYMHDGHGDGLRVNYGENIKFYNNKISLLGHDGLYTIESENVEAWNNKITCRINSALRVSNSDNVKLHNNFIDSYPDAGPGIQVQRSAGKMKVEIYENVVTNSYGPAIWAIGTAGEYPANQTNLYIHHNIFKGCGTNKNIQWVGGVLASGLHNILIENNVFDGTHNAAIVNMYKTDTDAGPAGKGFTITARNNIIINTVQRGTKPAGTGYAVINCLPKTHTIVLKNNCLYNNFAGNYKNCTSKTDIYANPLFADQKNQDYHLKSTAGRWNGKGWTKDSVNSPCIDAGYPSSNYSKEPEPNGDRINIGRYGNTEYASKSGNLTTNEGKATLMYDNRLCEAYPTYIYNSVFLDVGEIENNRYRTLMQFNLSNYTGNTQLISATLCLSTYYSGKSRINNTVIEIYRPAYSWNSKYTSWATRDKGITWKKPGSDWYDKNGVLQGTTPYAAITISGDEMPNNGYYEFDVTKLVQDYLSRKYANTGFLLKTKTEKDNYVTFYSAEYRNENLMPKLDLIYAES